MPMPSYPVEIAIHGQGGRKTRGNGHIRSDRQRRRAFKAESERIICKFERTHGVTIDPRTFVEMADRQLVELASQRDQISEAMDELQSLRTKTRALLK